MVCVVTLGPWEEPFPPAAAGREGREAQTQVLPLPPAASPPNPRPGRSQLPLTPAPLMATLEGGEVM